MKIKEYLFAYGSLRPSEDPPKTMSDPEKDSIRGDEIQFEDRAKHHWAEIDFRKSSAERIKGYTMQIDASELPSLDKREAPTYKRVKVETENGHDAWVYEYSPNNRRMNNGWRIR